MPRVSYEAHRAKVAGRRPSVVESETDAESLASYTTFQSGSSFYPSQSDGRIRHPSPRLAFNSLHPYTHPPNPSSPIGLHPHYPLGAHASSSSSSGLISPGQGVQVGVDLRKRTLSSSSYRDPNSTDRGGSDLKLQHYSLNQPETREPARESRRKAREERRSNRAKKSTLKGETYDSPLRSTIRWGSANDLSGWGLGVGLGVVWALRMGVGWFESQEALLRRISQASIPLEQAYEAAGGGSLDPPLRIYLYKNLYRILSHVEPALSTNGREGLRTISWRLRLSVLLCRVSLEQMFWWSGIIAWNVTEGKRGGRSWRTQLTGIMTVLLQPTLTLMAIPDGLDLTSLGMMVWTIVLLAQKRDVWATITATCAFNYDPNIVCFLPALTAYLGGKCLMETREERSKSLLRLAITAISTSTLIWAPWLWNPRTVLRALGSVYLTQKSAQPGTSFWEVLGHLAGSGNWISATGMARLSISTTIFALVPAVLIVVYVSLSLKASSVSTPIVIPPTSAGAQTTHVPPTFRLLLPALLASPLTFCVFAQGFHGGFNAVLMPLSLMMSLRGGNEVSGELEIWEMGVLICNTAVLTLTHLQGVSALIHAVGTLLWNWVIGYRPQNVQTPWLKSANYVVYPAIAISHLLRIFSPDAPPSSAFGGLSYPFNAVLSLIIGVSTWTWAHRKLIEVGWAISGLSSGPTKGKPN